MISLFWKKFFSIKTYFYFLVTAFRGAFLLLRWLKGWYFFCCLILFFKVGIWPFRFWVVEVCEGLDFLRGFIFLFLLKLLPFFGIFKYFKRFIFIFVFVRFLNLFGATLNLYLEKCFSLYKIFLWMSIRSVSYWLLIGVYSFYFFLVCYFIYSMFMFFVLYYQKKKIIEFKLWAVRFLLFLGGPPLFYLFFKVFFLYFIAWKFFYMGCLRIIFLFQRIVFIRVLMFSGFRLGKRN